MVKRKQETISFSDDEKQRILKVADGEAMSAYIRRQIMSIVKEEESQRDCRVLISNDKRPIKLVGGKIFHAKELVQ